MSTQTAMPPVQKKYQPYVPRGVPGDADDGNPGGGKRVPRAKGRYDNRRNLSGGGYRNVNPATDEGITAGRKHCSNGWGDRRVSSGRGRVYDPGICAGRFVAVSRHGALLAVGRADGDRRVAGHFVCDPVAARDGGGSGTSVPGIGGGLGDS